MEISFETKVVLCHVLFLVFMFYVVNYLGKNASLKLPVICFSVFACRDMNDEGISKFVCRLNVF